MSVGALVPSGVGPDFLLNHIDDNICIIRVLVSHPFSSDSNSEQSVQFMARSERQIRNFLQ